MHSAAQPGQLVLTSGIELMVLESSHSSHRLSRLPTTVGCMEDYNTESWHTHMTSACATHHGDKFVVANIEFLQESEVTHWPKKEREVT